MRIGVVCEGKTDAPIFEEIIPRIRPDVAKVVVRAARGKPGFLSVFPPLLWTFEYVEPGGRAEMAVVVRDANGQIPATVEAALLAAMTGRRAPEFYHGVRYHATKQETETWLLADVGAINRVAAKRGGAGVGSIPGPVENIPDAKEQFIRLLGLAKLPNVPEIVREIVHEIDLTVLRQECPGFNVFETKIHT